MFNQVWSKRPKEVANLFNPAFCCTILTASIVGYRNYAKTGLPFPLAFLIFPLVLHKRTRDVLPITSKTSLAVWIDENPEVKFLYNENVTTMKPFVGEAILFGSKYHWISYNNGLFESTLKDSQITSIASRSNGEVHDCILKARVVGKWLANSGTPETIMGLLGVKL